MEKKIMNSFGSIVIPAHIRKELELDGTVTLWVGVRDLRNGEKEIFLRKYNNDKDIVEKYKTWAEVLARVAESSVSIVWNGRILSMSSGDMTQDFIEKGYHVNPILSSYLDSANNSGVIIDNPEKLKFLPNGSGETSAFFKICNTGDDNGFFVIVKGTKFDGDNKISKSERDRRFSIIKDIVKKI